MRRRIFKGSIKNCPCITHVARAVSEGPDIVSMRKAMLLENGDLLFQAPSRALGLKCGYLLTGQTQSVYKCSMAIAGV